MNNQTYHERGALAAISDARPKLKGSAQKAAQYILNSPRLGDAFVGGFLPALI